MSVGEGGEKTKSEWEELESLSKDELIIELVKERTARRDINRSLRMMIDHEYPIEGEIPLDSSAGQIPSEEWARKIVRYASEHAGLEPDDLLCSLDVADYGVDDGYADNIIDSMRTDGEI